MSAFILLQPQILIKLIPLTLVHFQNCFLLENEKLVKICKIASASSPVKVKVSAFCIATLTERSLTSTASQVGRLQVRTTHGAAHTVAYDRLAPLHPPPAASLATRRPCSRTENVNPQPKLVPIHRPQRDERLGRPTYLRVTVSTLTKHVTNWPI